MTKLKPSLTVHPELSNSMPHCSKTHEIPKDSIDASALSRFTFPSRGIFKLGVIAGLGASLVACKRSDVTEEAPPWSKVNTASVLPPPATNSTVTAAAAQTSAPSPTPSHEVRQETNFPPLGSAEVKDLARELLATRKWFMAILRAAESSPPGSAQSDNIISTIGSGRVPSQGDFNAAIQETQQKIDQNRNAMTLMQAFHPVSKTGTAVDEAMERFENRPSQETWNAIGAALRIHEAVLNPTNWPPVFKGSSAADPMTHYHEAVVSMIRNHHF